jgi:hypothetical protein
MKSTQTKGIAGRSIKRIFVPSDFGDIIAHLGEDCPLVGGQAVAWWTERFGTTEKPLTSCDIDFWGYRDDLENLAKAIGKKPVYPGEYEMTAWVGAIPLQIHGEETVVEFINTVPGLDVINPERACAGQVFGDEEKGKKLLVLSPVSLVLAKLHALRAYDQKARQDELHLKISLLNCNRFILELLKEGKARLVLWNIERLIAASQTKAYRRLEREHNFRLLSAVPLAEIQRASASGAMPEEDRNRLRQFLSVRWPQVTDASVG